MKSNIKIAELRNRQRDLREFQIRVMVALLLVALCFLLLLTRFVWLQVVRHNDYHAQAEENRISVVPVAPNRGLIFDRNGVVLARNYSAYTLEITPSKIAGKLDEVVDQLATLVDIQAHHKRRFKKLLEESKTFESIPIRTRLSDAEVARFAAQRFRFPLGRAPAEAVAGASLPPRRWRPASPCFTASITRSSRRRCS